MSDGVRAVGVVPHPDRPAARDLARHAVAWLQARGLRVRVPAPEGVDLAAEGVEVTAPERFAPGLEAAVSIGGDGTMLRTVDLVADAGVPVLGVNAGRLGFLTAVDPDGLADALGRLAVGDVAIEERMMLEATVVSHGRAGGVRRALNEVVVEKRHPGHLTRLHVRLDGEPFTTYAADALIVATPTGSTAYAFSAHGPIVHPGLACVLLTPVSPHMLFDRALVLAPETTVEIQVAEDRPSLLTLDGRLLGDLEPGDRVVVRRADRPARLVTFGNRDFHRILRTRFGLAGA